MPPAAQSPGPVGPEPRLIAGPAPPPTPPPAAQIAEALVQTRNGQVDVLLHPEELGRIRLVLTEDGEITRVQLSAERPETLELLRRHSQDLADELRQAGLHGASFSFGDGAAGNPPESARSASRAETTIPEPGPEALHRIRLAGAGLDLRL